ncbi:uncharacterized protein LOC119074003 [Bradysia coprophila]|uniref:uncharacterized protein LOC119074003 n=1 Tax=Bradysia coprophila TaxID=38358 RepID=UPI00187D9405|nr:uncharacterized protein LOC119074003 [Bradysia coprophila]
MKYLRCAHLFMICCVYQIVSVKAKSNSSTNFAISKDNPNEKYKNHNMDGWKPIKPTLEYLKLNQRKNCVSVGFFSVDCKQVTEEKKKTTKYKSIVDAFRHDYHSPYGNYVAEIVPKLPNHYKNPLPKYRPNNRRQFRRFYSDIERSVELPRFIEEYPTNQFGSRSFREYVSKYSKRRQYPMFEPIPGQILYPPSVPQFIPNPLNEIKQLKSRRDDDMAYSRHNMNIKTFQSTIFPFFEHESVTKKHSTNNENVRNKGRFDVTSPVFSMVIEPTTIRVSSTSSGTTSKTNRTPIQYVYAVATRRSNKNQISNDFEKELPRKVVIESPPKRDDALKIDTDNSVISTKLSNRFLEYTTSGYSNYVTIKPSIDRPSDRETTEPLIDESTNEAPKSRIKVIPLLRTVEENFDSKEDFIASSSPYINQNRTYIANKAGFMNIGHRRTKKTTLKPQIYTLSSLLLDTDNQSASHQLPKPGQYVDHLSSTIINDYVGTTQPTEQPAEAVRSSITMKHQPPLPNKSNNQNTTNSRWTQPHELSTINNNDGINDRDQKIKDINLDIVITTDGPATNRNQIYSGINDGDEWNDGNVDGNSRALNGYGRVNVEPNVEWIMVAKSAMERSEFNGRPTDSRSERLTSASYKDNIVPMTMKRMPKVNNSNMVLGTNILVQ